jgi:hypothetical protein
VPEYEALIVAAENGSAGVRGDRVARVVAFCILH